MDILKYFSEEIRDQVDELRKLDWGICCSESQPDKSSIIKRINGWCIYSEYEGIFAEIQSLLNGIVLTLGIDCYNLDIDPKKAIKDAVKILGKSSKAYRQLNLF